MTCPHCGKPINPGSLLAKQKSLGMSKAERSAATLKARRARWAKSPAVTKRSLMQTTKRSVNNPDVGE